MRPFIRYGLALVFAALVPSLIMGFGISNRDPLHIFKLTLAMCLILCLFTMPLIILCARKGWINLFSSLMTGILVAFIPFLLFVLEGIIAGVDFSVGFQELIDVISFIAPLGASGGFSFWLVWYFTKNKIG